MPWAAIFLPVVGTLLAVVLGTHGWALFSRRRFPSPNFLEPVCRRRSGRCLAWGLGTSVVGALGMGGTYLLGPYLGRRPRPPLAGTGPVVICLHGLYHNPAAFVLLHPLLARMGFDRVLCPGYPSLGPDFETVARTLLRWLRAEVPARAPLAFVGHSLGGLLARRLAAEPDLAWRTHAIVTLGTPHGGSGLARLAIGRLGRALVPGGPLATLAAQLPDPPGAVLLSLASPVDNLVVPQAGLVVGRPTWREEATPPVSHTALLGHPRVLIRVAACLEGVFKA